MVRGRAAIRLGLDVTIETRLGEMRARSSRLSLGQPRERSPAVSYSTVFAATLFFREKAHASQPTPGRSSGFRFVLLAEPSRWRPSSIRVTDPFVMRRLAVALSGVRPRLQRRDRDGFAPSSLFSPASDEPPGHHGWPAQSSIDGATVKVAAWEWAVPTELSILNFWVRRTS
jgi:hypothetical protein